MRKTTRVLRRLPEMCLIRRAVSVIPHPQKAHRGGEDAFFSHPFAVSVADGVGGYAESGIDPALFTRHVMAEALTYVRRACGVETNDANQSASNTSELAETEMPVLDAVEAVHYGLVATEKKKIVGGCAVTCLCMSTQLSSSTSASPAQSSSTRQGECSVMNLGDCGTIVFRGDRLMFRTVPQQHYFNCPYQLPDDTPRHSASHARLTVLPGDVVFQASDGVFDNVSEHVIFEHLHRVSTGASTSDAAASGIAALASKLGHDKKFLSPFALAAQKEGYRGTLGGKLDDVTVLVAVVAETSPAVLESDAGVRKGACLITDLRFPAGKSAA